MYVDLHHRRAVELLPHRVLRYGFILSRFFALSTGVDPKIQNYVQNDTNIRKPRRIAAPHLTFRAEQAIMNEMQT